MVKIIKKNFWKCFTCGFQTTLEKEGTQHGLPYLQMEDGQMIMHTAHRVINLKGETIVNC